MAPSSSLGSQLFCSCPCAPAPLSLVLRQSIPSNSKITLLTLHSHVPIVRITHLRAREQASTSVEPIPQKYCDPRCMRFPPCFPLAPQSPKHTSQRASVNSPESHVHTSLPLKHAARWPGSWVKSWVGCGHSGDSRFDCYLSDSPAALNSVQSPGASPYSVSTLSSPNYR